MHTDDGVQRFGESLQRVQRGQAVPRLKLPDEHRANADAVCELRLRQMSPYPESLDAAGEGVIHD